MRTTPPDTATLADAPWLALSRKDFGDAAGVPTMLSGDEKRLYLWLAEHWAQSRGAIVDLGCFAGGSTAYLAEGCRRSGRDQPVHGLDRFQASEALKAELLYPAGIGPFDGSDIYGVATQALAPWAPHVTLHKGDILDVDWTGGPIEILVVDAAKSAAAADRIAQGFFPHLIPGQSLLIQQDFAHWKTPWLPLQMELLAPWFEPVAYCRRDTVVFLCRAPVDADALATGRVQRRRDAELTAALQAAEARLAPFGIGNRLGASIEGLRRNPNKRRSKDFSIAP